MTRRAPTEGQDCPDAPFEGDTLGTVRAQGPDAANLQFFIMRGERSVSNGDYIVSGRVTDGMEVDDVIKRGTGPNVAANGAPDITGALHLAR